MIADLPTIALRQRLAVLLMVLGLIAAAVYLRRRSRARAA